MVRLIINTYGEDKPGLVSDLSGIIHSLNGNILESKMVRLENIFTIIMAIEIPKNNKSKLPNFSIEKILNQVQNLIKNIKTPQAKQINDLVSKLLDTSIKNNPEKLANLIIPIILDEAFYNDERDNYCFKKLRQIISEMSTSDENIFQRIKINLLSLIVPESQL